MAKDKNHELEDMLTGVQGLVSDIQRSLLSVAMRGHTKGDTLSDMKNKLEWAASKIKAYENKTGQE